MSQLSSPILSPGGIFARIESLKKWQLEQQRRLQQQQIQQKEFLSNEHKRMYEALGLETNLSFDESPRTIRQSNEPRTVQQSNEPSTSSCNNFDAELGVSLLEQSEEELETQHDDTEELHHQQTNIDEIPIKSPNGDFDQLLEDKLKRANDSNISGGNTRKPKQPFLKRGAGLSRFRMTIEDLPYKKSKAVPVRINNNKTIKPEQKKIKFTLKPVINCDPTKTQLLNGNKNSAQTTSESFKINKPILKKTSNINDNNRVSKEQDQVKSRASWTPVSEPENKKDIKADKQTIEYKALLDELIHMRQTNPKVFEQSVNDSENQKKFEQNLLDELKLFELLEQNVANSSFSSTCSLVTRLMEHSVQNSPKRAHTEPCDSPVSKNEYKIITAPDNNLKNPILQSPVTTPHNPSFAFKKLEICDSLNDFNLDSQEKQFLSRLIQNTAKSTPKHSIPNTQNYKVPETQVDQTPIQSPQIKFKAQNDISQAKHVTNLNKPTAQFNSDSIIPSISCENKLNRCNTYKAQVHFENDDNDSSSINSDDISNVNNDKIVNPDDQTWSDDSESASSDKVATNSNSSSQTVLITDAATNTDDDYFQIDSHASDILKTRLVELEKEIETFRLENSRINKLKLELETEKRNFNKRKRQMEKEFEEKQKELNTQIEEEKRKVARERAVYDRYTREMRNKTTKKEREEIILLQTQLANVKEELKLKESRWGAAQARVRNQVKHLEKENVTLKADNEELRKKNGKLEATQKQLTTKKPSDTKMLHEINKNLTRLAKEAKLVVPKTAEITSTAKYKSKALPSKTQIKKHTSTVQTSSDDEEEDDETTDTDSTLTLLNISKNKRKNKENNRNSLNVSTSNDSIKSKSSDRSFESIERDYEKVFGKTLTLKDTLPDANNSRIDDSYKKSREEKLLEDGSKEITYANGNVKYVSPDEDLIVMKYYNGDVKETCYSTGTIKYFYAGDRTWHTTYPDGQEILEFSSGQIEKRFKDGSSEIFFPNGSQRSVSPGGTDEIRFPDGTVLITNGTGQKVLNLPNGQKEIHTTDHKRREYPDGTVKLLYADGTQETRYANGRIRLKDKHGNLIMDSASI